MPDGASLDDMAVARGFARTDDDEPSEAESQNLREIRHKAERTDLAEAELAVTLRERDFLKAGIDTDSKVGRYLLNTWEGSVEELVAQAGDFGITPRGKA